MIHFVRLRLSGFKSFVDSTELVIEPGLTGVVGPNGCGKSNLVEALRWVMGESSAKQMRGGEMDDVIFGGTASRPLRNLAEVALSLDNSERNAPAQFNDSDELEVVRRIERGEGSIYRVNGRETRARDVQVLFADAATGARSTAIIAQGRIGAIINAKPSDRRGLLEEAAGIGGLHSRRHEAELRLKAAEDNLLRLDDVLTGLTEQLQGLKRQVRQVTRYRTLSEQIRQTEAQLLAAHWRSAAAVVEAAKAAHDVAERQVVEQTGLAARAAAREADAAAGLPALRQAEGEAAAYLHELGVQRDQLDGEASRQEEAKRDATQRLDQGERDFAREAARAEDAAQAVARLAAERERLLAATGDEQARQTAARQMVDEAQAAHDQVEAELSLAIADVARFDAARAAAFRALGDGETRRDRLDARERDMAEAEARAAAEAVDPAELTSAEMDAEEAEENLAHCRTEAEEADHQRQAAETARQAARDAFERAEAARSRLVAEADALAALLTEAEKIDNPPILDLLTVSSGFEAALGVALGEDLAAPLADEAPMSWRALPPLVDAPALPDGAEPLSRHVAAPAALARRLAQIGLVDNDAAGESLRLALRPGQRLVTRDGALWRWDGFTIAAGAPSPAAARLRQRNRRRELSVLIDDAAIGLAEARTTAEATQAAAQAAGAAVETSRQRLRLAEGETAKLRDALAKLANRAEAAKARLAALAEQRAAAKADLGEAEATLAAARQALAAYRDNSESQQRLAGLRATAAECRARLVEARAAADQVQRESGDRQRRLEMVRVEEASWAQRAAQSARHLAELDQRRQAIRAELARLSQLPEEIAQRRQALLDALTAAELARRQAADRLAEGENALILAGRAAKDQEAALAQSREERIRREAALAQAELAAKTVAERIAERLNLTPAQVIDQHGEDAPVAQLEERLVKLGHDRDAIGPVNLRAETEARDVEERIAALHVERDDLVAAIARLRRAIADINRDGRDRLLASFDAVNHHFGRLFVRLFGGGRAHLTLTESPDPLQAGLEIMASPPGKRLQTLSLLSGGEQALTALALLFAVFMTNPAPICVLDEVDAPLDDANVDRFCTLVEEIARASRTRFLVVTHHRMTMARVDRLFGVTMAERGVSTIVSVDLAQADALREPV